MKFEVEFKTREEDKTPWHALAVQHRREIEYMDELMEVARMFTDRSPSVMEVHWRATNAPLEGSMKRPQTLLSQEKYLEEEGGTCPHCRRGDVIPHGGAEIYVPMYETRTEQRCRSCGAQWVDIYHFSHYAITREADNG